MKSCFIGKILICSQQTANITQSKVLHGTNVSPLHCFTKLFKFSPMQNCNSKYISLFFLGRDAAFIGPNENQFAVLDDDKTGLALYILPGSVSPEANEKNGAVEESKSADTNVGSIRGPMHFMFENEIDRIFSTPIGDWEMIYVLFNILLYIISYADHILLEL